MTEGVGAFFAWVSRRFDGRHADTGLIVRKGWLAVFIRLAAALASYSSAVLLARWLGMTQMGAFSFALAWLLALASVAALGLPQSAVRFLPAARATNDTAAIAGFLWTSRLIVLGSGFAFAVATTIPALVFRTAIDPNHFWALLVACAATPLVALVNFNTEAARGMGSVVRAYAPIQLIQPLLLIILCGTVVMFSLRFRSETAMVALVATYAVILVQQVLTNPRAPKVSRRSSDTRKWLLASFTLLLMPGVGLASQLTIIIVGAILLPDQTAIYSAAIRTSSLVTLGLYAVGILGTPKVAALFAQGRRQDLQELLDDLIHWIFWPALFATISLVLLGRWLLGLFGSGFVAGYPLLIVLAFGNLVSAATGPVNNILAMTGHHRTAATVALTVLAANVILTVAATPFFGILGAAVVTSACVIALSIVQVVLVRRLVGLRPSILSALGSPARGKQGGATS